MSSDEEDVHQCGRCKQLFYDIDTYFEHKKSRSCVKVKVNSGSLKPGSDLFVISKTVSTTNTQKNYDENAQKDDTLPKYETVQIKNNSERNEGRGQEMREDKTDHTSANFTDIHVSMDMPVAMEMPVAMDTPITMETSAMTTPVTMASKQKLTNDEFSASLVDEFINLKEVDEREKSALNDMVITILPSTGEKDMNKDTDVESRLRRSSRRSMPKKTWTKNFSTEPEEDEEPPKKKQKTAKKPVKKGKSKAKKHSDDLAALDTSLLDGIGNEQAIFTCQECEYSCSDETALNRHIQDHHENQSVLVCIKCRKGFTNSQSLKKHLSTCRRVMKEDVDAPKLLCLQRQNVDPSLMMKVEKDCKLLITFNCYVCAIHCSDFDALEEHVRDSHPEIRPAICPCCNEWFSDKQQLVEHLASGHKYMNESDMMLIQEKIQAMEDNIIWQQPTAEELLAIKFQSIQHQCTLCSDIFNSRKDYEEHYTMDHASDAKYYCETCHLRFKKKVDLRNHVLVHEHKSSKFYVCEICEKTFFQASHLNRHIEALHRPTSQMPEDILKCNSEDSLKVLSEPDPNDEVIFPCFVCPEELKSIEKFCVHMESHRVWVPHPDKGCYPHDLISAFQSEACQGTVRKIFAQKPLQLATEPQEEAETVEKSPQDVTNTQKDVERDPQINTLMTMFQQLSEELQDKDGTKLHQEVQVQSMGGHHHDNQAEEVHDADECKKRMPEQEDENTNDSEDRNPKAEINIEDHVQSSEDEPIAVKSDQLLCCFCFSVSPSQGDLYSHIVETHQLVLKWICNRYECDATFETIDGYREHHKEVHTQGSYICLMCNDHYHTMAHLQVHKASSHRYLTSHFEQGEGEYKCTLCTKNFIASSALTAHMKTEHRERTCGTCKKTFQTLGELKEHIATECAADHLCDQCGQVFTLKVALTKHRVLHDTNRAIACRLCGREFNKREHLRRHQLTFHTDEKPFKCTVEGCERSFKRRDKLQEHERCHSNKKPFKCPKCGRAYRYKEGLRYHLKTHDREEKYKCEICSLPFPRPGQLKQHLEEEHNVERKREHIHKCEHCNTTFARPERLKRHLEREHDLTTSWKFQCSMCPRGFQGEKSLQNHMKVKHGRNERITNPRQRYDSELGAALTKQIPLVDPAIGQQISQVPGVDHGLTLTQIGEEFFLMTPDGARIPVKQVQGQPVQIQGQVPIQSPQMHIQSQQPILDASQLQLHQIQIPAQQVQIQGQQIQQSPVAEHQTQFQEHSVQVTGQGHERGQCVKAEVQGQSSHEGQKVESSKQGFVHNHQSQGHQIQGHLEGTTIQIPDQHTDGQVILEVHSDADSSRLQAFQSDVVVETDAAQEILVENRSQQADNELTLQLQREIQQQLTVQLQKGQQQQLAQQQQYETAQQQHAQPISSEAYDKVKKPKKEKPKTESSHQVHIASSTMAIHEAQKETHVVMAHPTQQTFTTSLAANTQLLQTPMSSVSPAMLKLPLQVTPSAQNVMIPIQIGAGQFIQNQLIQQAPSVTPASTTLKLPASLSSHIKPKPTFQAAPLASNFAISTHGLQQQQIVIPVSDISAYQTFQASNTSLAPIMLNLDPATVSSHGETGDIQQTLQTAGLPTFTLQ